MEKQDINDLIKQAKTSHSKKAIQKVTPVKAGSKKNEVQFSFYLEKDLLKRLKQKALNTDQTIKAIINNALIKDLEQD